MNIRMKNVITKEGRDIFYTIIAVGKPNRKRKKKAEIQNTITKEKGGKKKRDGKDEETRATLNSCHVAPRLDWCRNQMRKKYSGETRIRYATKPHSETRPPPPQGQSSISDTDIEVNIRSEKATVDRKQQRNESPRQGNQLPRSCLLNSRCRSESSWPDVYPPTTRTQSARQLPSLSSTSGISVGHVHRHPTPPGRGESHVVFFSSWSSFSSAGRGNCFFGALAGQCWMSVCW